MFLQCVRRLALRGLYDRARDFHEVMRQRVVAHRVFCYEPKQVWPWKKIFERIAYLRAEPFAGSLEPLAHELWMSAQQIRKGAHIASIEGGYGFMKEGIESWSALHEEKVVKEEKILPRKWPRQKTFRGNSIFVGAKFD